MYAYKNQSQLPIKSWIPEKDYNNDQNLKTQTENLAALPFAYHHIAIMPDGHLGFGMPIGGVLATHNTIIPNAVGVDIGCGMLAVKIKPTQTLTKKLQTITEKIKQTIPTGFKKHTTPQITEKTESIENIKNLPIVKEEYTNAMLSLGTLGGGNHFIEIQKGSDNHTWIMIHSGSRNLGLKVANHYNKLAIKLNKKWHSSINPKSELAFLPTDTEEGQAYIREMQYCINYAYANRQLMMQKILKIIEHETKNIWFENIINIAHNYASLEHHYGKNVWVHRKGATSAKKGETGIIPGSMGTNSYITEGLGNKESFTSCSHGAGRKMGRKQAIRTLNLIEEQQKLKNIINDITNQEKLDEAPGAYKDINQVMENQKDLVKILIKLTPLASIKG